MKFFVTGEQLTNQYNNNEPLVTLDYIKVILTIKDIYPHFFRLCVLTSEERIPVAVIAKRLGNTPQMINEVYGHVIEEAEKESEESFDSAISL